MRVTMQCQFMAVSQNFLDSFWVIHRYQTRHKEGGVHIVVSQRIEHAVQSALDAVFAHGKRLGTGNALGKHSQPELIGIQIDRK